MVLLNKTWKYWARPYDVLPKFGGPVGPPGSMSRAGRTVACDWNASGDSGRAGGQELMFSFCFWQGSIMTHTTKAILTQGIPVTSWCPAWTLTRTWATALCLRPCLEWWVLSPDLRLGRLPSSFFPFRFLPSLYKCCWMELLLKCLTLMYCMWKSCTLILVSELRS